MAIPPPQTVDDLFDRHRGLMRLVARPPPPASAQQQAGTTDIEILAKHYRFVMPSGLALHMRPWLCMKGLGRWHVGVELEHSMRCLNVLDLALIPLCVVQ